MVWFVDILTLNHNQLQKFTISLQPNPSSLTAEDSPHSHSRSATPLYFIVICRMPFYNSSARTPRKTRVTCQKCVFIGSLPSDGCPSVVESVTSGMCLPSHCLAMIICVTMWFCKHFPLIGILDQRKLLRKCRPLARKLTSSWCRVRLIRLKEIAKSHLNVTWRQSSVAMAEHLV
jgi:hypothetical protein